MGCEYLGTYEEKVDSDFEGTIIDLETIGKFNSFYSDSRRYVNVKPFIFGFLSSGQLKILYVDKPVKIPLLRDKIMDILGKLERPFYAFNTHFERGVLFNFLSNEIIFERELNSEKYESKKDAVRILKIPNYGDPFNDKGILCMESWLKGDVASSLNHNRSDLLKERDILLIRGFREPDKMKFIKA